jgi:zinc/manganese transport system ATP-binding protein
MTHHAIDLHDVACGYDGHRPVLRGVHLHIAPGDFVGMVGPSGAGKTTLLKTLLGATPSVTGEVRVDGRVVRPGRPVPGVGYVPQTATVDWSFPATVENVVMMGKIASMNALPWSSRNDRAAVAEALEQLGIGGLGGRHIRDLSGGQQQRVFLARALIARPRILVLDEPTASVDVKTRDDILHLLAHLNAEGVTIVMTTHELNTVAAHLPRVVCVNGGIVAQGRPEDVFTEAVLSRTFNTEMRVVRDAVSGNLLVAEAGSHGPFADLRARGGALARPA